LYSQYLAPRLGADWPRNRRILEVGIGATNSSAYEAAALGATSAIAFEPFVALDPALDSSLLAKCAQRHALAAETITARVRRVKDLGALAESSIDLILSNSVLEHVADMDGLTRDLRRVLAPGGAMLHLVDYRDHYFRYPYHHLLWSDSVWAQWLNPGDLPRWRICDHVECFERHGLRVETLRATSLAAEFEKVRGRIHPRFATYDESALSTAFGVLFLTPGQEVGAEHSA
jgi:SAM-dependent methyltransferase